MRTTTIFILLIISINSWGQFLHEENDRFLTYEQNTNWLTTTKSFDKSGQWTAIRLRFFNEENCNVPVDSIRYSPAIIINGLMLNIPDSLTDKDSKEILNLLTDDTVEQIIVIDKFADQWTFCKPFSGVIILTVDKRKSKKLFKLKFG
jgi:hypothetical protein